MKFRTDFVTNSSSSNFMTVTLNFADITSKEITAYEEGTGWNGYFANSEDGGLSFLGYPIKTIDEFLACLYFYYNGDESFEVNVIPIFTAIFQFITKQIDFNTMMERLRAYLQENKDSLDWDSIYGLADLNAISPDDYENEDDLIEAAIEPFSCGSDDILDAYAEITRNHKKLSDIVSLDVYDNCRDYGDFLDHFSEDVTYDRYLKSNFPAMSKDDPLFKKEVNKWNDYIYENVFGAVPGKKEIEFDNEPDLEAGLETGDIEECFSDLWGANTIKREKIFIHDANRPDETESENEQGYESKCEDTDEHDIYFELLECLKESYYYPPAYSDKKLTEISERCSFPKCFRKYPITDFIDKAIETGLNNFLDFLVHRGLELDFADVAHYIFNDTLETLYPLFEKGLRIEASAYDALIDYANTLGKTKYINWLSDKKSEAIVK